MASRLLPHSSAPNPRLPRPSPAVLTAGVSVVLFIGLLLHLAVRPARAQQEGLTLEVVPSLAQVAPDEPAEVLVIVRNPATKSALNLRLSWFPDTGIQLTSGEPTLPFLAAGGDATWSLTVPPPADKVMPDVVHLRVDYSWQEENGTPTPHVATADLQTQPRASKAGTDLATVAVETGIETLYEQRPGKVYLVVTNKTARPLSVTNVETRSPDFIKVRPSGEVPPVELASGESRTFDFDVEATSKTQPGDQLLVFVVDLSSQGVPANVVVTQTLRTAILGESEILTILQVPSLVLLPGFIMLVAAALFWRIGRRIAQSSAEFPLPASTSEFWAVAIMISLAMAFLYPVVTALSFVSTRLGDEPGTGRDYLAGYGLLDLLLLWTAAFLVPFALLVGFVLVRGVYRAGDRLIKAWQRSRELKRTPARGESPFTILRKLERQGLKVYLNQIQPQGEDRNAFVLQKWDKNRPLTWIGPPIIVDWPEEADANVLASWQAKVGAFLKEDGDPKGLADVLEWGQKEGEFQVRWDKMKGHIGPWSVEAAALPDSPSAKQSIVSTA